MTTTTTAPRLSLEQTADICGVSTKTVRRWIAAGLLPAYRLGPKLLRIDPSDVESLGHRIPTAGSVAPPGATTLHGPAGTTNGEGSTGQARPDVAEALRDARAWAVAADMRIGHSKLSRLVRAFLANREAGETFGQWIYRDPTGETAVWNVLTGGSR